MKYLNFKKVLSNFDLANICNRMVIKLQGVFMKDQLHAELLDGNYIINLQSHNEGGSHWCCFVKINKTIYYFDPFGVIMPQDEYDVFKQEHDKIFYSQVQIQDMDSILCGYYCMAFLYYLNKMNGSMRSRMLYFQKTFNLQNQKENDKILIKFYKTLK